MNTELLSQVSEIAISYRPKIKASERPQITSSRDAEAILRHSWSDDLELLEEFVVLFLNKANKVTGLFRLSRGGTCGTVVDAKLVFSAALKALAQGIILAHNHPSGGLQPSQSDIVLTKKLKSGGDLLDIAVLDHLILTSEGYYSFADEGMI